MSNLPRRLFLYKFIRLVAAVSCSLIPAFLSAQSADPPRPPSLKTIAVPEPSNLSEFVIDKRKAIALGKALFWDMQVGSDGVTACASCHFNAGADSRSKNQGSPGLNVVHADGSPFPDLSFDHGPNRQLSAFDFPFRQLSDPSDRDSVPLIDSNDVVSSQGVFAALFRGTVPGLPVDIVRHVADDEGFRVGNNNVRRVEPRNTPTVINAVFNFRNFLDGRAQNEFNGVNNWGDRDPNARVFRALSETEIEPLRIRLTNASLASQAVAPPLSDREMSARGRSFPDLARKLLMATPLAQQQVHPEDSVLGDKSRWPRRGLRHDTYAQMIRSAFQPRWWKSSKRLRIDGNDNVLVVDGRPQKHPGEYSLMEYNFALFFGLAIQLYEATLVADDTPYDRFMLGDVGAISEAAIRGVDLFRSQARGRCINCHEAAELTGASVTRVSASPVRIREEQALDRGFNNIGVRPSFEDLFLGKL